MSRARTKVAEWWETEFERKNFEHVPGRTRENALDFARAYGGKVYHVTRYRLAPLVKLVWRVDPECPNELDAWHNEHGAMATVYQGWLWYIHDACNGGRATSEDEAKAACAARLLELGYLVVDEKGGAR